MIISEKRSHTNLVLKNANQYPLQQGSGKESLLPGQNNIWTVDVNVTLPIQVGSQGPTALNPTTIAQQWKNCLTKYSNQPALSAKKNGSWDTINFRQYYVQCMRFGKSLLSLNLPELAAVNIIGNNSPEWVFAFFGSVLARWIPVGIYMTNSQKTCEYISQHSSARIVIAQNIELAKKYFNLLDNGKVQKIVIFNDDVEKGTRKDGKIISWKTFMSLGQNIDDGQVEERSRKAAPGQCCTLVYTSGTTGMPKGTMLSHDNLTYCPKAQVFRPGFPNLNRKRCVSFLPLSHVAGLYFQMVAPIVNGTHIYFAEPTALKGTLIETLKEVRPHFIFAVPRVWEKIYARLKQEEKKDQSITEEMIKQVQQYGLEGTIAEKRGWQTNQEFKKAKALVFDKLKAAIGLDQAEYMGFGAAPLSPQIRKYFFSMNLYLQNSYGMTETTGPHVGTPVMSFNPKKPEDFHEVGFPVPGGDLKIKNQNNDQEGEICMRGRNVMMGYLKQPEETCKIFDSEGFLASGDIGKVREDGYLFITGRIKEIIITAGGQNVPPVLIEDQVKKALPCVSNVMVVGEQKPYLNCLISLLEDPPNSGNLDKTAANFLGGKDCPVKTVSEARDHPNFRKAIMAGLKEANSKAISRAQMVQNFYLMPEDFSVDNGTLTPSLKLKRKEALKKYVTEVEKMYSTAKL